ncbi:MAG: radical SAM protein [Nanoarchaeota archaeon]
MKENIVYVLWDITHKCSLSCKHCRANNPFIYEEKNLKFAKKVIDELAEINLKTLAISGGDPLLRKDLPKIVDYATKKGIRVRIQTNGQMVNEKILDKLKKAGCDEFGIGLDSCNEEYHDWLRNKKGVFKKTIRAIKLIKRKGFRVHIEFTLNPKNKNEIKKVIKLCNKLDVDTLYSRGVIPFGKGIDKSLKFSSTKYRELLRKLCSQKYSNNNLKIASEDPLWATIDKNLLKKVIKNNPGCLSGECISGCLAGINMFYINPKGKIYPCSFLDIELGDLNKESLKNILKDRKEKIPFFNRNSLKGKCSKCKLKYICGGCRARAFNKFKDYCEEDPMCDSLIYNEINKNY